MTPDLSTFAKVRALHDGATSPGEKAAAAVKMQTLARKAGMSVAEAVSRTDTPEPKPRQQGQAQAFAESFAEFLNRPEFVTERNEREARRRAEAAAIIERYGSEDALFEDTPMETALRAACEPLRGPGDPLRRARPPRAARHGCPSRRIQPGTSSRCPCPFRPSASPGRTWSP